MKKIRATDREVFLISCVFFIMNALFLYENFSTDGIARMVSLLLTVCITSCEQLHIKAFFGVLAEMILLQIYYLETTKISMFSSVGSLLMILACVFQIVGILMEKEIFLTIGLILGILSMACQTCDSMGSLLNLSRYYHWSNTAYRVYKALICMAIETVLPVYSVWSLWIQARVKVS